MPAGAHVLPPTPPLAARCFCHRRQLCLWKQLSPTLPTLAAPSPLPVACLAHLPVFPADALPSLSDIAGGVSDAASQAVGAVTTGVEAALSAIDQAGSRAWDSVVDLIDSKNGTEQLWEAIQTAVDAGAIDVGELRGELASMGATGWLQHWAAVWAWCLLLVCVRPTRSVGRGANTTRGWGREAVAGWAAQEDTAPPVHPCRPCASRNTTVARRRASRGRVLTKAPAHRHDRLGVGSAGGKSSRSAAPSCAPRTNPRPGTAPCANPPPPPRPPLHALADGNWTGTVFAPLNSAFEDADVEDVLAAPTLLAQVKPAPCLRRTPL